MDRDLVKFLQKTGVDTRFVSIMENKIFINNLKFSRFSRKKEELFLNAHPEIEVVRSKIFQKICTRASRNLAHIIHPKEKIFLVKNDDPLNFALQVVLEPYQRKYGIELFFGSDIQESVNLDIDSIASALTLDHEAENILECMLNGEKIELLSSVKFFKGEKMIYPLINIPLAWIYSWTEDKSLDNFKQNYETPRNSVSGPRNEAYESLIRCIENQRFSKVSYGSEDFLMFLEGIVPDVRENIYKSALFSSCNGC